MTSGARRGAAGRALRVRLASAKGRSAASQRWLERQLNDPYVAQAKRTGYRSRAAFKLIEIDDRYPILRPGARVVDLGAAPGGWSQVAAERVKAAQGGGCVVAVDRLDLASIPGVRFVQGDCLAEDTPDRIRSALGAAADVVLSDMAAAATGHRSTDHLRVMALCEAALDFARAVLAPGGAFLCKVLQGGSEHALLSAMRRDFGKVRHLKPKASRADSAELYVLATGFRGANRPAR